MGIFDKRFVVHETDDLIITHSRDPCTFGHYTAVFPRYGIAVSRTITDMDEDEYTNGMLKIYKFCKILKKILNEKYNLRIYRIYLASFSESTEITLHFHIIPRYQSDYYLNYIGPPLMAQLWQPPSDELIPELCQYVREECAKELES